MKCAECKHTIVMATDPKNDDYRIVSGAKRKNETWAASASETIELMVGARPRPAAERRAVLRRGGAERGAKGADGGGSHVQAGARNVR